MNTIQETDSSRVKSRRGLALITVTAVVGAIGIAVGADFGGGPATPMLAIDASVRDDGGQATPTVAPPGRVSEPLDPELLRLDRANEHHG